MPDTQQLLLPLFQMLNSIKSISVDLQNTLIKYFKPGQIANGTIILHEGEVCKNLWFLAAGLLRSFHTIEKADVTSRIMFTNHIVISPGSFFTILFRKLQQLRKRYTSKIHCFLFKYCTGNPEPHPEQTEEKIKKFILYFLTFVNKS